MKISVVLPALNEEENVKPMYQKVQPVLKKLTKEYEIIWVDDGSKDNTTKEVEKLHQKDKNAKCITFRRNFGKAAALQAGFIEAEGDIIITMDADLQDEPREIPRLINILNKGYDMVTGWKKQKHKGTLKVMPSKIFNIMSREITGVKIHDFNCPFKVYRKEVVKDMNLYGELHRYIPVLAHWKGYKIAETPVENYDRIYGVTKYGSKRIVKGFLDLVTVKYLLSYRTRPLHIFGLFGLGSFSLGFIAGLYLLVTWLMGHGIGGRPLLNLAILLMFMGVQFITIGLLAEMMTSSQEEAHKSYSIKKVLK